MLNISLISNKLAYIVLGAIAQLGEHLLCKQEVVGSIPTSSTRYRPLGFWGHRSTQYLLYDNCSIGLCLSMGFFVIVETGSMVLFPASLMHHKIPLESGE